MPIRLQRRFAALVTVAILMCGCQNPSQHGAPAISPPPPASIIERLYDDRLAHLKTYREISLNHTLVADELAAWYIGDDLAVIRLGFSGKEPVTLDLLYSGGVLIGAVDKRGGKVAGRVLFGGDDSELLRDGTIESAGALRSIAAEAESTLRRHAAGEKVTIDAAE